MNDINAIREQAENGYPVEDCVIPLCDEIEQLREDALRYQWLKNTFGWDILRDYLIDYKSTNNLDKVIDAAMGHGK